MSNGKKATLWLAYFVMVFAISMGLVSLPDWFSGGPISVEGRRHDDLFWGTVILSVVILSIVLATMVFALIHHRARPGDTSDGASIHGHNTLEIFWTLIPFIIVSALGWIGYDVLLDNESAVASTERGDRNGTLEVDVVAFQFGWEFGYPDAMAATGMRYVVPVDRTVAYNITSKGYVLKSDGSVEPDVIHSYWVPAARIKQDAVPGIWSDTQWTANQTGAFALPCAELCGPLHSDMVGEVCVVEEAEFDEWMDELREVASGSGDDDAAMTVSYPCGQEGDTMPVRPYANDDELLGIVTPEGQTILQETLERGLPHAEDEKA